MNPLITEALQVTILKFSPFEPRLHDMHNTSSVILVYYLCGCDFRVLIVLILKGLHKYVVTKEPITNTAFPKCFPFSLVFSKKSLFLIATSILITL